MPAMKGQKFSGFIFTYEVEGAYEFPVDMLRYDRAWPADQEAAAAMMTGLHDVSYSARRRIRLSGLSAPTTARWESFGWKVLPEGLR